MTLVWLDRVRSTTSTVGTSDYALGAAVTGFQPFSAVGDGNTCYYAVTNGTAWEVGLGTYVLGTNTLQRTTVLASSNGGMAVSWAAGTKSIWLDLPAAWLSQQNQGITQIVTGAGTVTVGATVETVILNKSAPSNTQINLGPVAPRDGLPLTIVDFNGNGQTVTVTPNGAETIMSLAQAVLISGAPGVGTAALLNLAPSVALNGWSQC